jgi:hypothetical protein
MAAAGLAEPSSDAKTSVPYPRAPAIAEAKRLLRILEDARKSYDRLVELTGGADGEPNVDWLLERSETTSRILRDMHYNVAAAIGVLQHEPQ